MREMTFSKFSKGTRSCTLSLLFSSICLLSTQGWAEIELVPGDTLNTESDTAQVKTPERRKFFSSPFFNDPFFDMDFDFPSSFSSLQNGFGQDFSTDLNIEVKDKKVIVTAQIPGSDKNNIDINVTKHAISISAQMKIENTVKDDNGNIISSSTQMRQFSNSQPLPVEVKAEVAKTDYKDGKLIVELTRI